MPTEPERGLPRAAGRVLAAWAAVLAGGLALGGLLRLAAGRGPTGFDRAVTDAVVERRRDPLTDAFDVVNGFGSAWVLAALFAAALVVFLLPARERIGVYLLLSGLGAELLADITKVVIDRDLPARELWLSVEHSPAFPSAHTVNATVAALAILFAARAAGRATRGFWFGVAGVVPALVGVARVYWGVHWATDVIAGWLMGAAWVLLLAAAMPLVPAVAVPPRASPGGPAPS